MNAVIDPKDNNLGLIKVTSAPSGGPAPLWVRKRWVGCELPCLYYDPCALPKSPGSFLTAFVVLQVHAIAVLAKVAPRAVQYWNSIGYPTSDKGTWLFEPRYVEVLKSPLVKAELFSENN